MSERIKELAEQAGYTKDMFGIGHWDMPECIRFAELVRQDERERLNHSSDVSIGVDVTDEGTYVVAFHTTPNDVRVMFYSQFHPMPKRELVGLTGLEVSHYNSRLSGSGVAEEIQAKLRERNI